MNIFSQDYIKLQNAYRIALKQVAATAVNFSKERFVRKDWVDKSSVKWKKTIKKKGSTLVASGKLKKSIRLVSMNAHKIILGSDMPYAKIHNEGGMITATANVGGFNRISMKGNMHKVKAHTRKMNTKIPARPFIGVSAILERRIERTIDRVFKQALTK